MSKTHLVLLFFAFSIGALVMAVIAATSQSANQDLRSSAAERGSTKKAVIPEFEREDFPNPTNITSKYFALPVGKKMIFEKMTSDGQMEKVQIEIPGTTKTVMGVKTLVYLDQVWLDMNEDGKFDSRKELIEKTYDYLAQDEDGNVWYFGEDVVNYNYDDNGKLIGTDTEGSWLAGKDTLKTGKIAKPGYWFPGNPRQGYAYYQEYYPGEAEDEARIVSTNATVKLKTPARINGKSIREFTGCVQTKDTTALDEHSVEDKYYCPQAGGLTYVYHVIDKEHLYLKQVSLNAGNDD